MRKTSVAIALGLTGALSVGGVATAGWLVAGLTTATVQASDPQLAVSGGFVQDVHPGGNSPTQLNVRNLNSFPVLFGAVTLLDVQVDENHSACPESVLSVVWDDPHTLLMPEEMRDFDVQVRMAPEAPQACTGATFQVVYRAAGTVGTP
jgi:hypothetical protein